MLRRSIEEGPQYVPLILDALPRWAELNDEAALPVIDLRGAIRIAPNGSPMHAAFVASAVAWGLDYDHLSADEVNRQFPAFSVPEGYSAMFEHEAGVLFADRTVRALQDRAARHGAALHFDEPVISWDASGDGVVVRTATATYHAARLVITAGSWTTRLAAELGLPLEPTRVVNVSFEPVDREPFGVDRLPAFVVSDGVEGVYGIPAIDGQGVKVGGGGTPVDPDRVDRVVSDAEIAHLRGFVDRFLPDASGPGLVGPHLSVHGGARRPLRHRPPPRTRQRRDRLAVLGPRLQVHDGDRPAAGRARLHRPDRPADRLVLDRPLRTPQPRVSQRPTSQNRILMTANTFGNNTATTTAQRPG